MELLVLTNKPERASCRQRIGFYLDILRDSGINCKIVTFPSGILARLKLLKHGREFDAIFLQKKRLRFCDAIWMKRYCRKIIYDLDDAVMYNDKNPDRPSRKRLKSFERTIKLADMVIVGNVYLAEHARKFNPNVEILPTGLDVSAYNLRAAPKNDGKIRLVWIGSKSTLKYLAEIKPALERIGERFSNAILRIICDDFFGLQNMKVEKHQWQKDTEVVNLINSDIGLAPLPDDRFTRGKCGFKILQYAAAKLPVVASPVGVNAEYVCDGVTGFHAINTSQWVDKISKLIENAELRKRMGREGPAKVKNFDIYVLGKRLLDLIVRALQNDECSG
ncbi:MAG: glycosyltransferase [Candidatus Heimdallarchaeota archaeon]|nr:MAG: glycosyltransferase [Candidatus Heimdallarchaeota archaeon]